MGIVANDHDHAADSSGSSPRALVERVIYTVTLLYLALGGDLVFQDETADLIGGDRAFQAVAAAGVLDFAAEIGVYGIARRQERDGQAVDAYTSFDGLAWLTSPAASSAGAAGPPPSSTGRSSRAAISAPPRLRGAFANAADPTRRGRRSASRRTAARRRSAWWRSRARARTPAGVRGGRRSRATDRSKARFGRLVAEIEVATPRAMPTRDGVTRRFTFDENSIIVGLVLFDQNLLEDRPIRDLAEDKGSSPARPPGPSTCPRTAASSARSTSTRASWYGRSAGSTLQGRRLPSRSRRRARRSGVAGRVSPRRHPPGRRGGRRALPGNVPSTTRLAPGSHSSTWRASSSASSSDRGEGVVPPPRRVTS